MCEEDSYRKGRYQIRGVLLSQIELGPLQGVAQLPVRRSNLTTQLRENNDVTNRTIYESFLSTGAFYSRVGFGIGFFRDRDFLFWARSKNPRDSRFFLVLGFLSPGIGIFIPGILFPGIRDFYTRDSGFLSSGFFLWDSEFFLISGFLSAGFSLNSLNS